MSTQADYDEVSTGDGSVWSPEGAVNPQWSQLAIALLGVSLALAGCAQTKLAKSVFTPAELRDGKSISVRHFVMAALPKLDSQPSDDPRQELASAFASALAESRLFGRVVVVPEGERVTTALVLEGAFVVLDDGERGSPLAEAFSNKRRPENHVAIAVNLRIVSVGSGTTAYSVGPIAGHLYRASLGPTVDTLRSRVLRGIAKRVVEDLEAELR